MYLFPADLRAENLVFIILPWRVFDVLQINISYKLDDKQYLSCENFP
jgi:hypothetical protein